MGRIRVEFVPIKKYNLGLLGLDHLQIVYEDETSFINKQDDWYVLEGTQDGGLFNGQLGVLGEDAYIPLAAANFANGDTLVGLIGTPEARGSRIVYQGPDALSLWNQMMARGAEIQDNAFPYEGLSWPFSPGAIINSSSVVATLLFVVGIDVNANMPLGVRFAPGTSTLLGTTINDEISLGGNFTQAATGIGEDILRGTNTLLFPEKFYGGDDNDRIVWSKGENFVHGGQPQLSYAMDGTDTIDYAGVGQVRIIATRHAVEHKVPNFISDFDGGSDQLFSIEAVNWYRESDIIAVGQGVELIQAPVRLRLDQSSGGRGDELGFQNSNAPLIVNAIDADMISIQTAENAGEDAGYWAQSVEWLAGSAADDRIYAGATLKGVEGGDGEDLVDGRLAQAFSRDSINGYDIELAGNDGNDTLVSGSGYSRASGGNGSDRFVLSAMSSDGAATTEFVIADADATDTLYVPYNFFKEARGEFDGSQLMRLTGAPFKIDELVPQSFFEWGPPRRDMDHGFIDFVGQIYFYMDGADLVVSLKQGTVVLRGGFDGGGHPTPVRRQIDIDETTTTLIRIVDWQEGELGLKFPIKMDPAVRAPPDDFYPNFTPTVRDLIGPDIFSDALDLRPEAFIPVDLTTPASAASARTSAFQTASLAALPSAPTEADDVIAVTDVGPYEIHALGGNDAITASAGGDVIDGGTGSDTMAGGRGNDAYFVDDTGDLVIENSRSGFDHVYAAIDYVLTANVEHLTLTGAAVAGTGNELRNTISGNDAANILTAGAGDDTLAGNRGSDTLSGGDGSDGYVYELGDGNDTILEAANGGTNDVLVFAGQVSAADFVFTRNPFALDDLTLRFFDGGSITIAGYFASPGGTIEGVEFVGGSTWDSTALEAFAASALLTANAAPVANDDSYVFAGANSFRLPTAALLENDRDPDGDGLTITAITGSTQGSAVLEGTDIIVTARAGADPKAVFTYLVADSSGATATATAEISFWANSAPAITSAAIAPVTENTPANGQLTASDADGDTLLYAVKAGAGPSRGTLNILTGGAFTYTPGSGQTGGDSFTVLVSDPYGASAEQAFTFDIKPPVDENDAPLITASALSPALEDAPASGNVDAIDPDGDTLTFVLKEGGEPSKGRVTFGTNGAFTYTPIANANGNDSFTVLVTDGHGGTAEQAFNFTIAPVNDAPTAHDDRGLKVDAGKKLTISASRLLSNDTDLDGDSLHLTSVSGIRGGTAALDAEGNVVFKAAKGFKGTAQFSYTVSDDAGGFDTATVSVVVGNRHHHHGHTCHGTRDRDTLHGSADDDIIYGHDSSDVLHGHGGNDVFRIDGDDGWDRFIGGRGYDVLQGSRHSDLIHVTSRFENLAGIEEIDGGGGQDRIVATTRSDVLNLADKKVKGIELISLGGGDDWVSGTSANETFSGDDGNDTFHFSRNCGHDIVADFSTVSAGPGHGQDILDLRAWHLDGLAGLFRAAHMESHDLVIELDAGASVTLKNVNLLAIAGDVLI